MFRGAAPFLRRCYGDTFCKGKISESVLRLDFQGDKTAQQRLKKPEKGVRILSPRFFIATSRAWPVAEKAVGSLLTDSFFCHRTHAATAAKRGKPKAFRAEPGVVMSFLLCPCSHSAPLAFHCSGNGRRRY